MKYLFIAEKPSLMREVQACYKNHKQTIISKVGEIVFTALAGHVCESCTPDDYPEWEDSKWQDINYPIIPKQWKIKGKKEKSSLLKQIKEKLKDCDGIIVGTDSDIEGYGIYWMLEHYLHLEQYKTLRFVEHSLTEKEILESLLSMTDYHTDPVHVSATEAYLVRSRADWLFGMNCTRMMTVKKGTLLRIGRVKAATLGIVYQNSKAIDQFHPETYYQIQADYRHFHAVLLTKEGKVDEFKEQPERTYPLNGTVELKRTKRVSEHAPKLFDLTTLQAEAGRVYGYTPAQTLEIVQSLYEKHKMVSYPRTQCCYVSSEKAKEFPAMLRNMSAFSDLGRIASSVSQSDIQSVQKDKQVVNDTSVAKESHDALLPTNVRPDLSKMTEKERNLCHMIYARLLAQFLPKATFDKTTLLIRHGDGLFGVSGRIVVEQGWRKLFSPAKDALLPDLQEGEIIEADQIAPVEKVTRPPKRLTQAALVHAMKNIANVIRDETLKKTLAESQGIGTPATRAAIIKELLDSGYMEDKKGGLYITKLGIFYIESLDGIDITSPVFAARLDLKMKQVQYGEITYGEGYDYVLSQLIDLCQKMEQIQETSWENDAGVSCPKCGKMLSERKYSCQCLSCGFHVNKMISGKQIDVKVLKILCDRKSTPEYRFKKKDGTVFRARLKVTDADTLEFDFHADVKCPLCGKETIRINHGGAFCNCGLKVFRKIAGYELTDQEIRALLCKKKLEGITDFQSRDGSVFPANLVLEGGGVKIQYKKDRRRAS